MARRADPNLPKATPLARATRPQRQKREARPDKIVAFQLGISAESRAAAFLIAKGFRILARRWKSPVGEIDIVARRRALLVFVEVKARNNLDEAAESLAHASSAASRRRRRPGSPPMAATVCATSASTPFWWRRASCRGTLPARLRRPDLAESPKGRARSRVRTPGRIVGAASTGLVRRRKAENPRGQRVRFRVALTGCVVVVQQHHRYRGHRK